MRMRKRLTRLCEKRRKKEDDDGNSYLRMMRLPVSPSERIPVRADQGNSVRYQRRGTGDARAAM